LQRQEALPGRSLEFFQLGTCAVDPGIYFGDLLFDFFQFGDRRTEGLVHREAFFGGFYALISRKHGSPDGFEDFAQILNLPFAVGGKNAGIGYRIEQIEARVAQVAGLPEIAQGLAQVGLDLRLLGHFRQVFRFIEVYLRLIQEVHHG